MPLSEHGFAEHVLVVEDQVPLRLEPLDVTMAVQVLPWLVLEAVRTTPSPSPVELTVPG